MRSPERFSPETNPDEQRLLDQFNNPEKIILNGEEIEVVDISPSPENLKGELPVLYLPGFSATPEALKSAILQTAQAGRRVISANAPHGVEAKPWFYKSVLGLENENPDLPEAELRKTMLLRELIKKKGLQKVSVIAHSEAAIWVTAEASVHPGRFSEVVYVDPAGLTGKDTAPGLAKKTLDDLRQSGKLDKKETAREEFLRQQGSQGYEKRKEAKYISMTAGLKSMASNPAASLREMQAIANADITPGLKKMHEAGIGIGVIHAKDDKVFDVEKVKGMLDQNLIDDFQIIEGSHGDIYTKELYGRVPEVELSLLEKKRQEGKNEEKKS
jgi:pimeloyl-ACP methyl ester carboxylesterase